MTTDRLRRLQDLFERAVLLPPPERERMLRETDRSDPGLSRELRGLLEHDAGDDDSFRPFVQPSESGLPPEPADDLLPDAVGGYRILRRLGSGGMGVVYEAEQERPRRLVALKVIRGGRFADDVHLRLFQREIETLARLDHPGIATVIESGRAGDGLPFFTMELVRGERLDRYAEAELKTDSLSPESVRRRLRLFLRICEAVHYAHQRGVVHRDLKPSNIVVTGDVDSAGSGSSAVGIPSVKILDFGLARLVDEDAGATQITRTGDVRGTLQYMSPEQAGGDVSSVDVRSDVYSLGVVLYRLLTGTVPYDLDGRSVPKALRIICETPPRSPSAVAPGFPRDLEAILLQSLEKDPERRYQSAHALREDLERFLARQPVQARAPSSLYQLRMMFERHRVSFVFAGLLFASLGFLAVTMTISAERTARERDRANREAATATSVSEFLVDLFRVADPEETAGREVTAREILDSGAERIREELTDQPLVRARLLGTLGSVQKNLGRYDEARSLLEEALRVHVEYGSADTLVAAAWTDLGALHLKTMDLEACLEAHVKAVEIWEAWPEHPELARALNGAGNALSRLQRFDEAEPYYRRALAIRRTVFGPESDIVAGTTANLGILESRRGDYRKALAHHEESLRIREKVLGPEHPKVGTLLVTMAGAHHQVDEFEEGVRKLERALVILEKSVGTEHPDYANVLSTLAVFHETLGDLEKARDCAERALVALEAALGPDHPYVGLCVSNLASIHENQGNFPEARELRLRSVDVMERAHGPEHPWYAASLSGLASTELAAGNLEAAERHYRKVVELQRESLGEDHPEVGRNTMSLAIVLRDRGELADARVLFEKAEAHLRESLGTGHSDYLVCLEEQIELLRRSGDPEAARTARARLDSLREE